MDFLRSYFFKNEPLISWIFFIKIRFSCNQNIEESNFDEKKCPKNVQLIRNNFLKIHTLVWCQFNDLFLFILFGFQMWSTISLLSYSKTSAHCLYYFIWDKIFGCTFQLYKLQIKWDYIGSNVKLQNIALKFWNSKTRLILRAWIFYPCWTLYLMLDLKF